MSPAISLRRATVVLPDRVAARPLFIDAGRLAAHEPAGAWALDLRDHLIYPSLVNAHDHLQLNNIPHLPAHAPFPNSYAWMAAFQPYFQEPVVASARRVPEAARLWHGALKNLLCGATTVAHHDPWGPPLDDPAFPVRLLRGFGWSHSLGLGLQITDCRLQIEVPQSLPHYGPPVVESFRATPADRPWIIHLAEGTDALAVAELSQLDALGCLAANTVLVHAVGLSAADVDRVIAAGAAVVWCPASNLSLLGRTLDPRRLFEAGRLALGSDSRISGSRDLLDELRSAAQSSCLAPAELLRLATADAGRVLGMPDIGGLDYGQRADLVIVRDEGGDPYQALLGLRRGDIRVVVRDGAPAVADPEFAGWFAACGVETVRVALDGRPKLLARALAWPDAVDLEPGLESFEF